MMHKTLYLVNLRRLLENPERFALVARAGSSDEFDARHDSEVSAPRRRRDGARGERPGPCEDAAGPEAEVAEVEALLGPVVMHQVELEPTRRRRVERRYLRRERTERKSNLSTGSTALR